MRCVRVNGYTSSFLPINQGIPQGTIIGPLLFLLFIDDISLYIQNSNIDIYADDGTLTSCSKWNDISQVNNNIQGDLDNIQRWAIMKKIAFNEKDTKSMLIIGKRLRKAWLKINIKIVIWQLPLTTHRLKEEDRTNSKG